MTNIETGAFDSAVPMRLKLAALWTSAMFCYIYADYFALYIPGTVADMLHGRMAPFGAVNQTILPGTSTMMAIPSVMIALSLLLPFRLAKVLNIVTGVLYTVIIAITMWSWAFFMLYGVIEMLLTGAIAWKREKGQVHFFVDGFAAAIFESRCREKKVRIAVRIAAVSIALLCAQANARTPKTLTASAATEIRGKTLTSVMHEARDVNIFGMSFLGDKEDFDALKSMLGDDLVTVKRDRGPGLVGDLTGTTDGYRVLGASVYDPAPHMAERIQAVLASRFGVRPLDQPPKILPATAVDRTVPDTNVAEIIGDGAASDLVLDLQTYGWQIYRPNSFTDLWFAYIVKMAIVDAHDRTTVDEWTCSYIDRHVWSSKPYLVGFLGNGKAALRATLDKAEDHCLNEILSKSLRAES